MLVKLIANFVHAEIWQTNWWNECENNLVVLLELCVSKMRVLELFTYEMKSYELKR